MILRSVIIYLLIIQLEVLFAHTFIPSFKPFCIDKISCRNFDCSCISNENCSLLEVDDEFRREMLSFHNMLREEESMKDKAAGMPLLQYNKDLEEISECWASKCLNMISDCFVTPNFPDGLSQVVLKVQNSIDVLPDVTLWKAGMIDLLNNRRSNVQGSETYTQMLSDRILFVGCSWSVENNWLTYVCTYGPEASPPGEKIFREGVICSVCPLDYSCNALDHYPSLCKPKLVRYGTLNQLPDQNLIHNDIPIKRAGEKKKKGKKKECKRNTTILIATIFCLALLTVACILGILCLYTYSLRYV